MVFSTEGFFEVAIESWPEWDLSLRPLNSVQALQPTELLDYIYIYIYIYMYKSISVISTDLEKVLARSIT